jgi:hypothetical protein
MFLCEILEDLIGLDFYKTHQDNGGHDFLWNDATSL